MLLGRNDRKIRFVGYLRELQTEARRVGDDVLDRLQLGHVAARLGGQVQAEVVGRQAALLVVRDGAATEGLSMGRYEQMRNAQIEAQPSASPGLPVTGAPVLPEAPRKP